MMDSIQKRCEAYRGGDILYMDPQKESKIIRCSNCKRLHIVVVSMNKQRGEKDDD